MKYTLHPRRLRFDPPTEDALQAVQTLTGKTSLTAEQLKAMEALGAPVSPVIRNTRGETPIKL